MMERDHIPAERLIDYAHGELAPDDDVRVHAHLAECTACAEAYDDESHLTELLRRHARAEEREMPPGLADAIYAAVGASRVPIWGRMASWLRPAVLIPAGAAAMLALYFGVVSTHGTARANAVDAAYYLENHAELATTVPFDDGTIEPAVFTGDEAR